MIRALCLALSLTTFGCMAQATRDLRALRVEEMRLRVEGLQRLSEAADAARAAGNLELEIQFRTLLIEAVGPPPPPPPGLAKRIAEAYGYSSPSQGQGAAQGQKAYRADECIGAVVDGRCHGAILPSGPPAKTCHGEWLGGQCTGPLF
jgi:hypothetical protein